MKKYLLYIIIFVISFVITFTISRLISNKISHEISYHSGIVVGQNHNVWVTNDTVCQNYETKINTDVGDVFIDHSKKVYENTIMGQEVKVMKDDTYYNKELINTDYDIIIGE